ncbi:Gldg family protein [Sphingobacterium corticis]|uniref:Gldg family protein n=1 Tax=Sphingobacterium corticis TaxID=1812823 RepID=A0ABW5NJY8_9SPHI
MKTTLKIAKTELQLLFYSPVAWLILMIFTFQIGFLFTSNYEGMIRVQSMKIDLNNATQSLFASPWGGIFPKVQSYLYLYIPLLTMGMMSREYSSGSIKLLYSSPITNAQIILGKYLALLGFGLILIASMVILILFTAGTLVNADLLPLLSGLIGLYLLLAAYAAIGLFMSSLTNYNIVAAIGTLCIFAIMNYARGLWQDVPFVREITYWLGINGRADLFISGLITSEDFIYFLLVSALFLSFSIYRLQGMRHKESGSLRFAKIFGTIAVTCILGYLTTLPASKLYYDTTYQKRNTLTQASQDIMSQLDGDFTITTYVNMLDGNNFIGLPSAYKSDVKSFEKYTRFKPETNMKYVYYYHDADNPILERQFPNLTTEERLDTLRKFNQWNFDIKPYSEIKDQVDLSTENYRFVRVLERENGKKTFLRVFEDMVRVPSESEISAAIKRLVIDKLPTVGLVSGHGERDSESAQDRGYKIITQEKTFRYSMVNQGFDFTKVDLSKPIDESIQLLVLAEPRGEYSAVEFENLKKYIESGKHLLIAGEPDQRAYFNALAKPLLGVSLEEGVLISQQEALQPDLMILKPTIEATKFSFHLEPMLTRNEVLTMPSAGGLHYDGSKGFEQTVLFQTDSTGIWNEKQTTNFIDSKPSLDSIAGEKMDAYPTVLALSRKVNGKEQKILVTGDADWISNSELFMQRNQVQASNFSLVSAAFYWLSDGEVPVDMRLPNPIDTTLRIKESGWFYFSILLKWIIPVSMLLAGLIINIRRRGR